MRRTTRFRRTAAAGLILGCLLLSAGAGPALALERAGDDGISGGHEISLLERVGDFFSDLMVDLGTILFKDGPETGPDG